MDDREGHLLAHHLGCALQLTNILRDIDEDAAVGRLYLPSEALRAADIEITTPTATIVHPAIGSACQAVASRAREHFAQSAKVLSRCPRRAARAPKIMQDAYREILDELIARDWSCPRLPVRVSRPHLLRIALRHAFA